VKVLISSQPKLTPEIKLEADAIVARFNVEQLRGQPWAHYVTNYRGAHLWATSTEAGLDRSAGSPTPVTCNTGISPSTSTATNTTIRMSGFFSGAEEVDGTIEGAMRAGLKAYPA
jgi:hypothetical protein